MQYQGWGENEALRRRVGVWHCLATLRLPSQSQLHRKARLAWVNRLFGFRIKKSVKSNPFLFCDISFTEEAQVSKNCPRANGFFPFPAEESCQKFWDCRGGKSYLQECPVGVIFDPKGSPKIWQNCLIQSISIIEHFMFYFQSMLV